MVVVEGVLEAAEEAGVFGVVVGAKSEEFTEFGEDGAGVVLDEGSVAGGPGLPRAPPSQWAVIQLLWIGDFLGWVRWLPKRLGEVGRDMS